MSHHCWFTVFIVQSAQGPNNINNRNLNSTLHSCMPDLPTTINPALKKSHMSVHPDKADAPVFDKTCSAVCSRQIGKYPCIIFLGMLLVFFGMSVPYKDAPGKMSGTSNNDWTVTKPPTNVNDMWNDARRRTSAADPDRKVKARSVMETQRGSITYLYKWDDATADSKTKDVFTPATIQEMCELERNFVDDSEYETTYCLLDYSNNSDVAKGCAPQRLSAPRLFYAATFVNHTIDCPYPSNYRTLMASKQCMDYLSLTTVQATNIGNVAQASDFVALMTAFGKKAAAPGSLTPADQTLLDSANAATLTANNNAGLNFLTCSGKNGNAQWTTSAGVTVTTTILTANPTYHKEECVKIIQTIREKMEEMLPVPITVTNPEDSSKYYLTAMPGMPSKLFNFTNITRPELTNGYQLTGNQACPLLPQWHVDAVKTWLYTTVALPEVKIGESVLSGEQLLGFYMGKDTLKNKYTIISKSMIYMGSPLSGYKDSSDNKKEQEELYKKYMIKFEPILFNHFGMAETKTMPMLQRMFSKSPYRVEPTTKAGLQVDWYCGSMMQNEFDRMLGGDFMMVVLSILFVWIWIQVHVWSPTIGGLGMLQILLSIPVTYTVYSIWIPYYSQMHILAVFLVLGVGADDVFVLTDGWKQSVRDVVPVPGETKKERLVRRMTYAYGRTASAVFNTSLTTA